MIVKTYRYTAEEVKNLVTWTVVVTAMVLIASVLTVNGIKNREIGILKAQKVELEQRLTDIELEYFQAIGRFHGNGELWFTARFHDQGEVKVSR